MVCLYFLVSSKSNFGIAPVPTITVQNRTSNNFYFQSYESVNNTGKEISKITVDNYKDGKLNISTSPFTISIWQNNNNKSKPALRITSDDIINQAISDIDSKSKLIDGINGINGMTLVICALPINAYYRGATCNKEKLWYYYKVNGNFSTPYQKGPNYNGSSFDITC